MSEWTHQQTIFGLGKQANLWSKIFCDPGDNCQEVEIIQVVTHCACGGVAWGKRWCRDLVGKGQGWAKRHMMHDTATTAENYWIQILAVSKFRNPDLINIRHIYLDVFQHNLQHNCILLDIL